ncbi:hypothetical protein [Bradyrhizobium prioriisuperbiae]|uniref:hypothetical protein n=1 Tax=Bradyrhizobium prioriisuperbiae TaxID=2854389 RepID=UPI0028E22C7F|nr:hypothetical protein [Bradyrhizobium prioritasuperba]
MDSSPDPERYQPARSGRRKLIRWLGFSVLLLVLPLALFAIVVPPNEYKAQGIDALDCDGPIGVYLFALPALLIYGAGAVINGRCYRNRLNLSVSVICVVLCLLMAASIGRAYQEQALMARDPLACR